MARSHARVKVEIWRDDDWIGLSPKAKLLYLTILSQPRLNLVGMIDLATNRWAVLSGMSRDHVESALGELEIAGFVIIDSDTDELLVRTFVAHDLEPGRVNRNLAAGFWGAWGCVASPLLRSVSIHGIPAETWEKLEPHAPADALQTRRSPRLRPVLPPSGDPGCEPETESRSQPPVSSLLPPVTTPQPDLGVYETPKIPAENVEEAMSQITELRARRRSSHEGEPQERGGDGLLPVNGQANPTEAM